MPDIKLLNKSDIALNRTAEDKRDHERAYPFEIVFLGNIIA